MFRRSHACALVLLVLGVTACSREYISGTITVTEPWGRATPGGATVGAGYMKVANRGSKPIRLLGGTTPAAEAVEIHTMTIEGGVMRMRPFADGLEVAAGSEVELKPGGMHLMLMGLKRPLSEGERVPLTLVFDGGKRMDIELSIEGMGGRHGQ